MRKLPRTLYRKYHGMYDGGNGNVPSRVCGNTCSGCSKTADRTRDRGSYPASGKKRDHTPSHHHAKEPPQCDTGGYGSWRINQYRSAPDGTRHGSGYSPYTRFFQFTGKRDPPHLLHAAIRPAFHAVPVSRRGYSG